MVKSNTGKRSRNIRQSVACVYAFFLTACMTLAQELQEQSSDRIAIGISKNEVVPFEPLNIEVAMELSKEDNRELTIVVNEEVVEKSTYLERRVGVNLPKEYHFMKEGEKVKTIFHLMMFLNIEKSIENRKIKKFIFDKAGEYKLKIVDPKSKLSSNVVTINVRNPTPHEADAARLFIGGKHAIQSLLRIGGEEWHDIVRSLKEEKETLANFEKIVKDYSDTPFAPYASHIIGVIKDLTLPSKPWKEITAEIKEIIPYFLPALKIERSRIQEEALYYIIGCYDTSNEDVISTEEDKYLEMLLSKYPLGKYADRAKGEKRRKEEMIDKKKQEKK